MYAGKTEEWGEYLLRITEALYRVTGLLPHSEPLRMALRKYANVALAGCVGEAYGMARGNSRAGSAIEALLGFLAVARTIPEVKEENFLVLEREYRAFLASWAQEAKARIGKTQYEGEVLHPARADRGIAVNEKRSPAPGRAGGVSVKNSTTHERQQEILERLTKTPQARVSDFYAIFNGVSPKTIQRDLQDLVARNAVKKEGERRWTTYTLAG